MLVLIELIC